MLLCPLKPTRQPPIRAPSDAVTTIMGTSSDAVTRLNEVARMSVRVASGNGRNDFERAWAELHQIFLGRSRSGRHVLTAVDDQHLSGDERGLVGRKERRRTGEVLGPELASDCLTLREHRQDR